jgi:hypothetical protein
MKYFCKTCGSANHYELTAPKFCSNCGKSTGPDFTIKPAVLRQENFRKMEFSQDPNKADSAGRQPNPNYVDFQEFNNNPLNGSAINTNTEDIDSEYYDTSKFTHLKPKFKVEVYANRGESLENVVTNGYISNTKPQPIIGVQSQNISPNDILKEFSREAGSSRNE